MSGIEYRLVMLGDDILSEQRIDINWCNHLRDE